MMLGVDLGNCGWDYDVVPEVSQPQDQPYGTTLRMDSRC